MAQNPLFRVHFPSRIDEKKGAAPLIALGMLQWGTISILDRSRILSEKQAHEIYQAFRSRGVVIYDTAEGYGGGTSEKRLGRLLRYEEEENKNDNDGDTTTTEDDDQ